MATQFRPLAALLTTVSLSALGVLHPAHSTEIDTISAPFSLSAQSDSPEASAYLDATSQPVEGEDERPQGHATAFNDLVADISSKESKTYSFAEWKGEAQPPSIYFAGTPSQASIEIMAAHPSKPRIFTDAPASRASMDLEMQLVSEALSKDPSVDSFIVAANPQDLTMAVDITRHETSNLQSNTSRHQESVSPPLPELQTPLRYSITESLQGAQPNMTRGGKAFGGCTTAFTVQQGGSNGVLTAGHCANYAQVPAGSTTKADYRTEHMGRYGDFQWHSTLDALSRYISLGADGTRSVSGYAIANRGTQACNFGKTRARPSCGTVVNESVCVQYTDLPYVCSLVAVQGSFTNPGDSGGPWYIANRTLGIHSGSSSAKNQMYYSRVDRALSILRLNLYIK